MLITCPRLAAETGAGATERGEQHSAAQATAPHAQQPHGTWEGEEGWVETKSQ